MDTLNKQEFRIRDLPTRSVTLFPTRAQVVRDIKNVPLKSGANEITILGLSPSVDEDSIKVEGTGSAIISDIAVELLPNRDIFEEIYPDSDDDKSDDDGKDESDDDEAVKDSEALTSVRDRLTLLRDDEKRAAELVANAGSRLKILDAYGKMLDRKRGVDIDAGLETYRHEREKVFQDHMDGTIRIRQLAKEIDDLRVEETRLLKLKAKERTKAEKVKAKSRKTKAKQLEKKRRREAERLKEKARILKERESFWPRYCWSIKITLDAVSFTPSTSRRSSVASASDLVKVVPEKEQAGSSEEAENGYTCDLSLSYVVSSAFWSPSYDLALSTTANTALLCFDAQLTNRTSENWTNCKIILSTSQATFSGLQDAIPTLVPWRVRLGGRGYGSKNSDILDSREERAEKGGWQAQQNAWGAQKSRAHLYGHSNDISSASNVRYMLDIEPLAKKIDQSSIAPPPPPVAQSVRKAAMPQGTRCFGAAPGGAELYSQREMGIEQQQLQIQDTKSAKRSLSIFGSRGGRGASSSNSTYRDRSEHAPAAAVEEAASDLGYNPDAEDADGATILGGAQELSFQESAFEETGLTTTYDLPGLKTLTTSSIASKQRVARITFNNVSFSHTVVAKYKPVAYLKAKLRNASKITLLKGPVGLTLDGSFMGRANLPRCSAGDSFTMSLGVDPAIGVTYPKPEVKRSTTGLFTKEDSSVYTRTITISNTRANAGKAITLVVNDQVPVSEDDRLRVEIVHPKGMTIGGVGVPTGVPGKEGKDEREWGTAKATLKKAGEVSWDVSLNAGRTVKLNLEYEVALPAGDCVVQC